MENQAFPKIPFKKAGILSRGWDFWKWKKSGLAPGVGAMFMHEQLVLDANTLVFMGYRQKHRASPVDSEST